MNNLHSASHGWAPGASTATAATEVTLAANAVPQLSSKRLLGEAGEAVIEHEGHLYRLRRTSRGGLVLTK